MIEPLTSPSKVILGYVIQYVEDVESTLRFYETAFGLSRRFLSNEDGMAYGELDTGSACLAFANEPLVRSNIGGKAAISKPNSAQNSEIALVTMDVDKWYKSGIEAGGHEVKPPQDKPWGQRVAYLEDINGHLIELCTPMNPT